MADLSSASGVLSGLNSGPAVSDVLAPGKRALSDLATATKLESEAVTAATKKKADIAAKETSGDIYKDLQPVFDKTAEFIRNPRPEPESPKPKETDPIKAWGSFAMLAAMLGSAFTRAPMTTALTAASKALDAMKQNDIDTYEREFKNWQTSMTAYEKINTQQEKAYQWAVQEKDRRFSANLKERAQAETELRDNINRIATIYKDDVMAQTLAEKGVDAALKVIDDRTRIAAGIAEHQGQITQGYESSKILMEMSQDPNFLKMSARDKAQAIAALDPRYAASLNGKYLEHIEKTVENLQKSPLGRQYFVLQTSDQPVQQAEQEIAAKQPAIDGVTSNSLIDIYSRAVGGGVARRFIVDQLAIKATYDQKANALIGQFDPNGGGMSSSQASRLIAAIKEQKASVQREFESQVNNAAATLEHYGGSGDQLRKRAGLDGAPSPEPAPAAANANVPPALVNQASAQQTLSRIMGGKVTINRGRDTLAHEQALTGGRVGAGSEHVAPGTVAYDFSVEGKSSRAAALTLAANLIKHGYGFDQILIQPRDTHAGWGSKNRGLIRYETSPGKLGGFVSAKDVEDAYNKGEISGSDADTLMTHYGWKHG